MSGETLTLPEAGETGRVPPGYKQTEVGVIPEDWGTCELQDLGRWLGGATPSMGNVAYWSNGNAPWASSGDVKVSLLNTTQQKITDVAVKETSTILLPTDSIIVVTRSGILRKYLPVAKNLVPMAINQDLKALLPNRSVDPDFVLHQLIGHGPKILATCQKSGTTVESIEFTWLKLFRIPLPPLPEQRAIAAALSDVDDMISSLERLISKKRAVKTAAMQQLLTGKRRLPGFSGEWETKRLGEVVERIVGGGTPSRANPAYWGNEIPWVTVKDFATFDPQQTQESITEVGLKHSASNLIPKGTLITSTRMALGKAVIYEVDVSINQDLKAIYPSSDTNSRFLYYWFEYNSAHIESLGSGSTVKGISLHDLRNVEFLAAPLEEQTAIATVLSDMDAEIEALEARREKTRRIKQGMMQELLTGRTRLA
ncbi:restriction endonuclease subunit S [soil metagenome]